MNDQQIELVMKEILDIIVEEARDSHALTIICRVLIPILDELKSQYPQYALIINILEKIAEDQELLIK